MPQLFRLPLRSMVKALGKLKKAPSKAAPIKALSDAKHVPESFKKSLAPGVDPARAWSGYRHQAMSGNDESLLLWPLRSGAEKIIGHKNKIKGIRKVRGGMWNRVGSKALLADAIAGRYLQKIPLAKGLFTLKEEIPWGKGMKKEISRASALAPLAKARDIAEPILVGVGLEKGLKAITKKKDQGHEMADQHLREKVASVMLSLHEKNKGHEKRAQALKLLYKQAELGLSPLPQSFSELESKLASLVNEDLVVLEKALDLSGANIKIGELGTINPGISMKPEEKFRANILGDEL